MTSSEVIIYPVLNEQDQREYRVEGPRDVLMVTPRPDGQWDVTGAGPDDSLITKCGGDLDRSLRRAIRVVEG